MLCKVFREERLIELTLKMSKVFRSGGKNLPPCFKSLEKRFKPKQRNKRAPIVSQTGELQRSALERVGKRIWAHYRELRSVYHLLEAEGAAEVLREDLVPMEQPGGRVGTAPKGGRADFTATAPVGLSQGDGRGR